jgi:outer membrane receptor protein involved in Fe transport
MNLRHVAVSVASVAAVASARPALAQTPPASAPPVEVTVRGTRRIDQEPGADAMGAQTVRSVPGTFGDPFQSLLALPGVAPMASGLPYFYVRGAPPADTGYFIDGIPLPTLFHIGPGPSYVPPGLLDQVELYPSTAPARFGRYVGGIMIGETRAPSDVAHGEGSVRLFDASALAESPIGDSSTALVAGRYGYPNVLLGVFAPTLSLGYGDYTVRLAHRLTEHDTISLFAIGGFDHLEDASQQLPPVNSQFHRIDLRYDHRWEGGSFRVATTFGVDHTQGINNFESETAASTTGRLRFELDQRIGTQLRLVAGADANTSHYAFGSTIAGPTSPIGDEEVAGAYADLRVRLGDRVTVTPGIRVDRYQRPTGLPPGGTTVTVDPKLAARIAVSNDVALISTFGVAHQEPAYVLPIPGLVVSTPSGFQVVDQIAGGVETKLPLDLNAKLTGFFSAGRHLTDFVADCGELFNCSSVNSVDGRTFGIELLVRRPFTKKLAGWISYTLSRAERTVASIPYLSPFDRTHDFSGVVQYDFEHGVKAAARFTYYTGRPDFPSLGYGTALSPDIAFGPGQVAQHRLPSYARLDLRAEKRWQLGRTRWLSAVVEFFNVSLTKEPIAFTCSVTTAICNATDVGPIALPSVGVEGGF